MNMKARKHFTLWVSAALIAAGVMLHTSTGLALLIAGMVILMINVLTL